jgi:hypothetical protein
MSATGILVCGFVLTFCAGYVFGTIMTMRSAKSAIDRAIYDAFRRKS